ncbi:hypothetical protein SAMN07250955_102385 [Arboricoccus pini]|uniref:FlgN protein n=1 Tax=Arboricoccus pini TaxID=1963835 RepID=A0A212QQJ3_9PROT|nr:hypothetical protein [Arboricoccus pini]SNB61749.1 hypothetical protein SAMN07250955_102385 [Arboricoccus pini]
MMIFNVRGLNDALDALLALIEAENEHVGRMDLAPCRALQTDKMALLDRLEQELWQMRRAPGAAEIEGDRRAELGRKLQAVQEACALNQRRLGAAKRAVDRLIACVVDATREPDLGLGVGSNRTPVIVDHRY